MAAPGLPEGLFGSWAAPQAPGAGPAPPTSSARSEPSRGGQQAPQPTTQQQQEAQEINAATIFDGLWLLAPVEEEGEEQGEGQEAGDSPWPAAAAAQGQAQLPGSALAHAGDELAPAQQQAQGGSSGAAAAAAAAAAAGGQFGPFGAAAAAAAAGGGGELGDALLSAAGMAADSVDTLLADNAAVVSAQAGSVAAAAAAASGTPKRGRGDLQWAVRGGWPDLDAAWKRLKAGGGSALQVGAHQLPCGAAGLPVRGHGTGCWAARDRSIGSWPQAPGAALSSSVTSSRVPRRTPAATAPAVPL